MGLKPETSSAVSSISVSSMVVSMSSSVLDLSSTAGSISTSASMASSSATSLGTTQSLEKIPWPLWCACAMTRDSSESLVRAFSAIDAAALVSSAASKIPDPWNRLCFICAETTREPLCFLASSCGSMAPKAPSVSKIEWLCLCKSATCVGRAARRDAGPAFIPETDASIGMNKSPWPWCSFAFAAPASVAAFANVSVIVPLSANKLVPTPKSRNFASLTVTFRSSKRFGEFITSVRNTSDLCCLK
mmetsp:Transcript_810/g.3133  ORF Transcript_810/g.3133 Transcript_810/m.3133 type:complete len:246 (+) Transcript_810:222-959(+)